ncbi:MAG TPA: hypothetical protein VMB91_12950 [Solirubrobacteraceae bacterium]|nr:hypothetical protein [Solirubrobacteraceae bacterium]
MADPFESVAGYKPPQLVPDTLTADGAILMGRADKIRAAALDNGLKG